MQVQVGSLKMNVNIKFLSKSKNSKPTQKIAYNFNSFFLIQALDNPLFLEHNHLTSQLFPLL